MADLPEMVLRLADLATRRSTTFALAPDAGERAAIAADLGIAGVRKLRFDGELSPVGKSDWALQATLGATVVQDCVITLDPVTSRIDEQILRNYVADYTEPTADEAEMSDDDSIDPLPASLDIAAVMIEALSLALPAFPRADGAVLDTAVYTEPGKAAMTDDDAKPFAGLGALRDALEKKDETGD